MSVKIAFISLGCDKNLVDSEIMLGLVNEKGYQIVQEHEKADIIIINSCGFIMNANEEAIENILNVADYKETGSLKGIIVTGCMAQRYKEEIFESLPEVDAVVGTGDFESIGEVIDRLVNNEKQVMCITDMNKSLDASNSFKRIITSVGGFSFLKIAEGCDKHCTYCTIPSLRGKYRSRDMESLIKEAELLAAKGVRELVLIAQDTSLYGTDLYGEKKLPELLRRLSEIEDIRWIRILYCYPENIDDSLINEIAENPKVLHYLDMPIQHINNRILKLMGRKSTRESIEETISGLRKKMPDFCIRSTLIVGFPSESDEEFEEILDFIQGAEIDRLGVFTYSREEGTPAYDMPNQIDEEIKAQRMDMVLECQKNVSARKCAEQVGKTLEVIIEGRIDGEGAYCARSYRDAYEIDGFVFFESDEEILAGDFRKVKITSSSDYDLIGELCDELTE